ncbi:MAG: ATP-binding protein [Eubacteriales bacterium]|nr:ATP-binding protein [Eubacteriales bacterium]
MNKKIFRLNFFTSLFALLISIILVFGVLFDYFEAQVFSELASESTYISYALEHEGASYIDNLKNKNKRITLISPDGTVLADTSANPSTLDNHTNRKEIRDAMTNGNGKSVRYSNTLMQKNLYYAQKLDDGKILRVSATQNSVIVILLGLLPPIMFIVISVLIASVFLAQKISKSIVKPINALDLDDPAKNEAYEELTPLLKKISIQKKTIDRQLHEANQRQEEFKLITENMSEGLLVIDNHANVLSYNQSAIRLLELDNVKSGSVLTFNRTRGFRNTIEKALGGERAENEMSLDEYTYNLIATPVYENDKIIGAVIVIIDITENVKREQLRREFTSNVSHELKTPLTSILGFAEIMKSGKTPDETVIDFSTSIYDEAQRLIMLVSDIMKISELDENPMQFEKEKVDLYELACEVTERLKPFGEKQGIVMNVIGDQAFVNGTRKILYELIYNLCDNAIKYNKENGIVDVIISQSENDVNLTVRDTGIGIPLSEQNRVFERFYRVDKSHSKIVGGTGLGLAIVKHAALYHNADIKLESIEGKGTTIKIKFAKYDIDK